MRPFSLIGKTFGNLIPFAVINQRVGHRGYLMMCQCACGNYRNAVQRDLESGHCKSCGCLRKTARNHGYAIRENGSPKRIYRIWCAMIQRCHNPKSSAYRYYGSKGIAVCQSWRDFNVFLEDMGKSYREDLTIHRVDNALGYCPTNCVWADSKTQMSHTSRNRHVEINGQTKIISEWARHYGITVSRIYRRISKGWSVIDAISKPKQKWTKRNESTDH